MTSTCPSRSQLEQLIGEQLDPAADASLTRHLEGCQSCQTLLQQLLDSASGADSSHSLPRLPLSPGPDSGPDDDPSIENAMSRLKARPPTSGPMEIFDRLSGGAEGPVANTGEEAVAVLPQLAGFEILQEVGRGGTGIIYKARQRGLNRIVAIKMLQTGAKTSSTAMERLRAEAKAVARLQHPNIVQIYEVGEHDGQPFLALEFAAGGSLRDHLDGTPWSAREAAALIEVVARAVEAAHAQGIIHRDLKPANILLQTSVDGRTTNEPVRVSSSSFSLYPSSFLPKVADFGLAKVLDSDLRKAGSLTETGEVLGTPSYMAPEQAKPDGPPIGPAVDTYALGTVLYELLTGRPPFVAETPLGTLLRVLNDEPLSVTRLSPTVPHDLETICLKCLEKQPGRRYASTGELAEDLRRFQAEEPILARPPSSWDRGWKFVRRHKALVAGVAATVAAMFLGTVVSVMFAMAENHQRHLAEDNADEAKTAREKAERETYQARLSAALLSLNVHNLSEANNHLLAAPVALRGWEWQHLHSRLQDEAPVILPRVTGYEYLPFGRYLVRSNAREHKIWITDASSGTAVREMVGLDPLLVQQVRGEFVLVALKPDSTVVLVDEAGLCRSTDIHLSPNLGARDLSPIGTQLAVASTVKPPWTAEVFELASGKVRLRLLADVRIDVLAFSPDGKLLAVGYHDGKVQFWDAISGAAGRVLSASFVLALAFSPDGRELVTGSGDGSLCQWDVASGRELRRRGHFNAIFSVVYSPDGRWLVSGSADRTIRFWRIEGGDAVSVLGDHPDTAYRVAFCGDSNHVAAICTNTNDHSLGSEARVWPSPLRADSRILPGHSRYVYAVAFSPDGRWFASGGWGDHTIHLWDAASGELIVALKGPQAAIGALAVSPDGRRLAVRSHDGKLRIWDMTMGRLLFPAVDVGTFDVGHPENVAITADGDAGACGCDGRIRFWDLSTGQEQASLPAPVPGFVRLIAFNPQGTLLAAVVAWNPRVFVIERKTGQVVAVLAGPKDAVNSVEDAVNSICFSPEGQTLLTTSADRTVRLWNAANGEPLRTPLLGHTDEVFTAVFIPGTSRIASGGRDRVVRIWDRDSGVEVARLPGHHDYIMSLACSPDGATLVSGSGDSTVRLWDTFPLDRRQKARQELQTLGPEADHLITQWFNEADAGKTALSHLNDDKTLSEPLRRAAWHAVLRRVAARAN
jgi:eukaryotic-like serine/threonine-protein kinase